MIKIFYRLVFVMLAVICFLFSGCGILPESTFELARESRLPKWFTLPPGVSRADVTVSMSYYITWRSTVVFTLMDAKKHVLAERKGVLKGSAPLKLKQPPSGFPEGYPSYRLITVDGVTELIEHRKMEPIFYISDDPAVWAELNETSNAKEVNRRK